jgi:hypothetical protein
MVRFFVWFFVRVFIRFGLPPLLNKGFKIRVAGDNVSFGEFIALVDKIVEGFIWNAEIFEESAEDIGREDARLLCGKGGAHLEKDESIAKFAVFLTDKVSYDWVQRVFMFIMKTAVYPLSESGFADQGKAHAFLGGYALKLVGYGRVETPQGDPAGLLFRSGYTMCANNCVVRGLHADTFCIRRRLGRG